MRNEKRPQGRRVGERRKRDETARQLMCPTQTLGSETVKR